jgi:hypothetical protein
MKTLLPKTNKITKKNTAYLVSTNETYININSDFNKLKSTYVVVLYAFKIHIKHV